MTKKKVNSNHNNQEASMDKRISDSLGSMSVPKGMGKEAAWNKLMSTIEDGKENKGNGRTVFFNKPLLSIAASLVFIIALSAIFYIFLSQVNINANRGEIVSHSLPDNTEVTLNADSKISYKRAGWLNNRVLQLEGEAYFNVTEKGNFTVISNVGQVIVTGTAFNVYSRGNNFDVSCDEGQVLIKIPGLDLTAVIPIGNRIIYRPEDGLPRFERYIPETSKSPAAWMKGVFYFKNAPLSEVFEEIERQFDVNIFAADIQYRRYTGYFRKEKLSETLDMVCIPMNLNYRIEDEKNIIVE